jgi:hypothetical protein
MKKMINYKIQKNSLNQRLHLLKRPHKSHLKMTLKKIQMMKKVIIYYDFF